MRALGGAVAMLWCAAVACGGSTSVSTDGGAGDSATVHDGSSGVEGGTDCVALRAQVDALRPKARVCCPTCNHAPCTYTVPDLCCALTVDVPGSPAITAFENAVTAFQSAGCPAMCPGAPCPAAPSLMCDPTTSLCQ